MIDGSDFEWNGLVGMVFFMPKSLGWRRVFGFEVLVVVFIMHFMEVLYWKRSWNKFIKA